MPSLKNIPVQIRTGGALPAAGAYDAQGSATIFDATDCSQVELLITYTQGGALGSAKFKILVAYDSSGTFFPRTIDDGTINVSGSESFSKLYVSAKQMPVGSGSYSYILDVSTIRYIIVLFAEVGNTATPGTVSAWAAAARSE